MDRRRFSFYAIAFALLRTAGAEEVQPSSESLGAIYTAILQSRCNCCSNHKDAWFIASHTYSPELPQLVSPGLTWQERARSVAMHPYIAPPPERVQEARLLVLSLEEQLSSSMEIPRQLSADHRYRLISEEEQELYWKLKGVDAVYDPQRKTRTRAIPAHYRREFAHAVGLVHFSPIGFTPQRNLVLCSYRISDGCTEEGWCVLERSASGWNQLKWETSRTIQCA